MEQDKQFGIGMNGEVHSVILDYMQRRIFLRQMERSFRLMG